jgi:hypothetical protein
VNGLSKDNRYGDLIIPLGLLNIIVVVLSNTNSFTFFALLNREKILGMLILANFFVEDEGLAPCIMRNSIILSYQNPQFLATLEFFIHGVHELN